MILESREVTKKYGSKTAVNQVSLQLEPGLVYAMLGPNGSGKTTWMKMVAGLVKPTSGEILYQGTPIGKESKKEIAYMSTEPYFYNWMTVSDVGKYYEDFFEDFFHGEIQTDDFPHGAYRGHESEKAVLWYDGQAENCSYHGKEGQAVLA